MNLASWLLRAASSYASRPAVAFGDQIVATDAQLARRASGLATGLREDLRLRPGDAVAIAARNDAAYLETLFGIWWAGLVAVPINAKLHPTEIDWIATHSATQTLFVSADLEAAIGRSSQAGGCRDLIVLGGTRYNALCRSETSDLAPRDPTDLAWLFYTSGTTGRPKGAMISPRNLIAMAFTYLAEVDPTTPGDAILHAAPMSHGCGLYSLPHVARAALNVIPESGGFDPAEIFHLIRRHPATSFFAAPTMIKRLLSCPDPCSTESLRTIVWGGAPMHPNDIISTLDRFGPRLAQIYGQGETPMTITVLSKCDIADRDHPNWPARLGSAGLPSSIVEVRVADQEGNQPPSGVAGEVVVRGDTVISGYWNDPVASAHALAGGWLHTGDIGCFDDNGYLSLRGRANDTIISGGSNIYPREIEDVLSLHSRVLEVSVIGRPDDQWGEIVVAYVVGDAPASELDRLCLDHITRFKRPRDYGYVESLPKNNYGKILKTELRAHDRSARSITHSGKT
jgi:long-chain acyl-CoA synthetase